MKKRVLSILLCTFMAVSILAGCGSTSDTSGAASTPVVENSPAASSEASAPVESSELKPSKLVVWAHWQSAQRRPTIDKIISNFNEKYKAQGIEAKYVGVPFDEIETKLVASVASGKPANAVVSAIEDVGVKGMRKQATNIKEYLDPATKDLFYPIYWNTVTYEDGVYALPFNSDTRFIFYNKKMFEEAGVKAEEITSWDAMFAAADKLDAKFKGTGNYKAAFLPVIGNFGFEAIAFSNGKPAGIFDDPFNPNEVVLDNANNVQTLDYMRKWSERYGKDTVATLQQGGGGAQDAFISGQVAMFGQVCNYIATLKKNAVDEKGNWLIDYDVLPHPAGPSSPDGKIYSAGGGFVVVVPYGAQNPRESTKFVEYMCGDEASSIWGLEQNDVMCNIKANENPELLTRKGWELVKKMLETTIISRRHPFAPKAGDDKNSAVNGICLDFNGKGSQEALTEAANNIKKKIADDKAIWGE